MAIRKVRGIIVRRREATESSLILSVFSDKAGKLNLLAKGALRKKSPFKGRVELFSLCHLTHYENPRRGLNILSESDLIDPLVELRSSLPFFMTACYLVELVDMGTGLEQESPGLFNLLKEALSRISSFPDPRALKRKFELSFIELLGYHLHLGSCASCRTGGRAFRRFSARAGGVICDRCAGESGGVIKVSCSALAAIRYLQNGSLNSAARLRLSPGQSKEVEAILRSMILFYLDRRPKSLLVGVE